MFSGRSGLDRRENRLSQALRARRRQGRETIDLTCANPTELGLTPAPELLATLADRAALRYRPEPRGLHRARCSVAELMSRDGPPVDPERIVLTASTSEAYGFLFKLLCDPGERVLIPRPSYPLFEPLCRLESVEPAPYPLRYDGHWYVDRAALAAAIDGRARALVMVHPNNPTGSYVCRDDLRYLAAAGPPLISDEVFAPYALERDANAAGSAREAEDRLAFTLHGLSKLAGLPQLKLSWICVSGPDAQVAEALGRLELIADAFLSVSTPVQLATPAIVEQHGQLQRRILERLRDNHGALRRACADSPCTLLRVEGGWSAVLRLPATMDDEAWSLQLLEQADVLVQPGYFYDFERGPFVVLSLLTEPTTWRAGIDRVFDAIEG